MAQKIGCMALLVHDYDEAIEFFVQRLGFELREDTVINADKRWVRVAPSGNAGTSLLLAKAASPEQAAAVGRQSGGRVFLFLHTDDFEEDYRAMQSRGVKFLEEPRAEAYGKVAVFADLYGNKWDLLQAPPV